VTCQQVEHWITSVNFQYLNPERLKKIMRHVVNCPACDRALRHSGDPDLGPDHPDAAVERQVKVAVAARRVVETLGRRRQRTNKPW
jgi:hypothetical protein